MKALEMRVLEVRVRARSLLTHPTRFLIEIHASHSLIMCIILLNTHLFLRFLPVVSHGICSSRR